MCDVMSQLTLIVLATVTLATIVTGLGDVETSWQSEWMPNFIAKAPVFHDQASHVFEGMMTEEDGFKLLLLEDDKAFVGAKNRVYYMSLHDSKNLSTLVWEEDSTSRKNCEAKGKNKCSNYIRVVVRKSETELYVCGTNAFNPSCRTYDITADGQFKMRKYEDGFGVCPFDPDHNSTAILAENIIYSGTDADENNRHPIILRKSADDNPVRTQGKDSMFLNEPQFVSSFEKDDKVFFFFRENAVENINCGKSVFSRVARVCKSDKFQDQFTSFFKARLNCSIPGDFPFYFDEIQATSFFGQGNYQPTADSGNRHDLIYGVFSTPENSVHGSAVCAFRYKDIVEVFKHRFKGQEGITSNWLPVNWDSTPVPHPAAGCHEEKPSHESLKFSRNHALMDEAVPAQGQMPILVHTSFKSRLTSIAIDWQRRAADGNYYDILFVGTDDGRVIKAVNKGHGPVQPVVIEDTQVLEPGEAVVNLKVLSHRTDHAKQKLVVISKQRIVSIPLHRCALAQSCRTCVGLQDPYCVWKSDLKKCLSAEEGIQSIATGKHSFCNVKDEVKVVETKPPVRPNCQCPIEVTIETRDDLDDGAQRRKFHGTGGIDSQEETNVVGGRSQSPHSASGTQVEILVIAVIVSIIISLLSGFVIGYKFQSCRSARDSDNVFYESKTATLQRGRNRLSSGDNHYLQTEPLSPKQMNYVVNLKNSRGSSSDVKPVTKSNKVYL